jgi:thiamine kinase-like enzyme
MAALHVQCWDYPIVKDIGEKDLVFPVGIGQRMHPLQKEGLFITSWEDTVNHLKEHTTSPHDNELLQFAIALCDKLTQKKHRTVHDLVQQHQMTLIRGDFYIANWLLPENLRIEQKPYLIDWATAGFGNPMDDFVSFLVVSTNDKNSSRSTAVLGRILSIVERIQSQAIIQYFIEYIKGMV